MSSATMILDPAENAELLQLSANGSRLLESTDRRSRAWKAHRRDLVLCMERHRLLVVVDGDRPRPFPAPKGGVLVAFTDDEAAEAWAQTRHPAEGIEHRFMLNFDAPPISEQEGRRWWSEWFDVLGADDGVIVNPAGPQQFVVTPDELRATRSRLRRAPVKPDGEPWLDLDARAAERARVPPLIEELAQALDSGDSERIKSIRRHTHNVNRLGNGLWVCQNQLAFGRWRIANGMHRIGITLHLHYGALAFAAWGDPYRGIDGLLESVELLLRMRSDGVTDPEAPGFVEAYLRAAEDALRRIRVGYRDEEIDQHLAQIDDETTGRR